MDYLLTRESKYPGDNFNPGEDLKRDFPELQVLVVGAGGLGCEILKNLALCGIKNIFVIDLDTIELSNLNRQFLFRQKDIGKYKAEVASQFIKEKFPNINILFSTKKVQELADSFFRQFNIIIGGLDNIEARLYINQKVHDLVQFDENGKIKPETVIPFIDGGTEGLRGQAQVIYPYTTSCFRCVTDSMVSNRKTYALCTIANNPRIPEHCIEYAYVSEWSKHHKNPVDKDSIEDVNWIYETALARAKEFNIEGVTYNLTLGVIKNIIPAIASTNALIAASTVMECLKIWSGMSKRLDNYFMYMGQEGIYGLNQEYGKNPDCKTCTKHVHTLKVDENESWKNVIGKMIQLTDIKPATNTFSIYYNNSLIYDSNPEKHDSEINENKTVEELVNEKTIEIGEIFEIIPKDDENNTTKIRIKRQKDIDAENEE